MYNDILKNISKNNYYSMLVSKEKNRGYLNLFDYWEKADNVPHYLRDMEDLVKELNPGFTILVNAINYKGCSSEICNLHIGVQKIAQEYGLSKAAEVYPPNSIAILFSASYSRESKIDTHIFKNVYIAEKWLDLCVYEKEVIQL
jgi:hypothetical protein